MVIDFCRMVWYIDSGRCSKVRLGYYRLHSLLCVLYYPSFCSFRFSPFAYRKFLWRKDRNGKKLSSPISFMRRVPASAISIRMAFPTLLLDIFGAKVPTSRNVIRFLMVPMPKITIRGHTRRSSGCSSPTSTAMVGTT